VRRQYSQYAMEVRPRCAVAKPTGFADLGSQCEASDPGTEASEYIRMHLKAAPATCRTWETYQVQIIVGLLASNLTYEANRSTLTRRNHLDALLQLAISEMGRPRPLHCYAYREARGSNRMIQRRLKHWTRLGRSPILLGAQHDILHTGSVGCQPCGRCMAPQLSSSAAS
jgi:hypothetical protein